MYSFEFVRPTTVADAVAALKAEGAQALSGGHDADPDDEGAAGGAVGAGLAGRHRRDTGLSGSDGGTSCIGGAHHPWRRWRTRPPPASRHWPSWPAMIGDPAVRNRGTIGGSLANNDPSACYPAAVLASRRDHRHQRAARSRRTTTSRACSRPRSTTARSSPTSSSRSRRSAGLSEVLAAGLALRAGRRVRGEIPGPGRRRRSPARRNGGVFRWTAAEAALAGELLDGGGRGADRAGRRHDRRPARHAGLPRASGQGDDRPGGGGGLSALAAGSLPVARLPAGRIQAAARTCAAAASRAFRAGDRCRPRQHPPPRRAPGRPVNSPSMCRVIWCRRPPAARCASI